MNTPDRDPFALARSDADIELTAAEQELQALLERAKRQEDAGDEDAWSASLDEVYRLDNLIATTPATTLAGAAVKLRRLLDPELGLETTDKETDAPCLHQILAVIERESGSDAVLNAPDHDGVAPGLADPLIALGAEQVRRVAQMNVPGQEEDVTQAEFAELNEIEAQIHARVPISAAGAVVLVRYLKVRMEGFEWCECDDQVADNLIAWLERLGKGGAA